MLFTVPRAWTSQYVHLLQKSHWHIRLERFLFLRRSVDFQLTYSLTRAGTNYIHNE
jgi:hypothetical protein